MSKRLSQLLHQSALAAEQERQAKNRFDRICEAVKKNLAHKHKAEAGDDDLVCPSCGYKGPEADFEPDADESDGYSTDDETGETGGDDPDNVGDRPAECDNLRMRGLTRNQVLASLNKIRC